MSNGQSKGRKFERNRASKAMAAYNGSRRDLINKAKKIAKHKKNSVKKTLKVPKGTTRAKRRGNPCNLFKGT